MPRRGIHAGRTRRAYRRPCVPINPRRRSQFNTFYHAAGCALFLTSPRSPMPAFEQALRNTDISLEESNYIAAKVNGLNDRDRSVISALSDNSPARGKRVKGMNGSLSHTGILLIKGILVLHCSCENEANSVCAARTRLNNPFNASTLFTFSY